jgi:anaphase-promoting complex subunit 4
VRFLIRVNCHALFLTVVSAGHSSLINFPFIPSLGQANNATTFCPTYVPFDPSNTSPEPTVTGATVLDLESAHAEIVLHAFPTSGPKAKPVRIDVNGRKGRRVICVLFAGSLHYEVLDMDSQVQGEDDVQEENHIEDRSMSE